MYILIIYFSLYTGIFIAPKETIHHDRKKRQSELHHPALLKKLTIYAAYWRDIGVGLRFTPYELNNIQARPLLLHRAPTSWLSTMLAEWLQGIVEEARTLLPWKHSSVPSMKLAWLLQLLTFSFNLLVEKTTSLLF